MPKGVSTGKTGQSLSADLIHFRPGDEPLPFDSFDGDLDDDDVFSFQYSLPRLVENTKDSMELLRQNASTEVLMKERTRAFDQDDRVSAQSSERSGGVKKKLSAKTNSVLWSTRSIPVIVLSDRRRSYRSDGSFCRTKTTRSFQSAAASAASTATAHDVTIDPNHGLSRPKSEDLFMDAELGNIRFRKVRELGKGGFGVVELHMDLSNKKQFYAVKSVTKICRATSGGYLKELAIGKLLDHPNIIKLFHVIEGDANANFRLVMELCTGGDLADLIGRCEELGLSCPFKRKVHVFQVVFQVLSGLAYLHHYNMCHRDIKPENYMLSRKLSVFYPPVVKLIDFGLARATDENNGVMYSQVGSWRYAAPEVLQGFPYRNSCDLWGLGITLYTLIALRFPYPGENGYFLLKNILSGSRPPNWEHSHFAAVGPSVTTIIRSLMELRPGKRPRCADILACNPWLHKYAASSTQSKGCFCMP